MRSLPARVRIGGESGVNDGDRRLVILILQILEESPQLPHKKHSLVDNRSAGQGNHIGVLTGLLEDPAGYIELPVKGQPLLHILRFLHESLHDIGHAVHCLLSQHIRSGGNGSPSQEFHPLLLHDDLKHLLRLIAPQLVLGEEKHTDTVGSLLAQVNTQSRGRLREKAMGNLKQDSHTVAGLSLGILSCPVLQIFYDLQRIGHGLVCLYPFHADNSADTAVVMLKFGTVQSHVVLFSVHLFFLSSVLSHSFLRMA